MQARDYLILASTVTSFILTIVSLAAGHKHDAAENVAILTFPARAAPATRPGLVIDGATDWLVSLHYLSICIRHTGNMTSFEGPHTTCDRRPGGYTFHPDDPFIRQTVNGAVVLPATLEPLHTVAPFTTLVLAVVFVGAGSLLLLYSALPIPIFWTIRPRIHLGLLLLAATMMAISAISISVIIGHHEHGEIKRTRSFLGIIWSAVGLIYVALILKAYDMLKQWQRVRALRDDSDR
ncbi:hypothetical protein PVAG01_05823 [Phlyctema vagabunda]|uniref:Pali-domain-containing protein n=1 Tax=Phlyctema vagabunda TaxID=108571 RepID=A0ABR4PEF4_9HELO